MTNEIIYRVSGMHCASCELVIEKKILEFPGVKSVEASNGKNEVVIEYEGEKPTVMELNKVFRVNNYNFNEYDDKDQILKHLPADAMHQALQAGVQDDTGNPNDWLLSAVVIAFLAAGFMWLKVSGLSSVINVNNNSSLPMFFAFGLIAGFSTCAALVGGIILSLAKQWASQKYRPHLLFNLGRLLSFGLLGVILGLIGQKIQMSLFFSSLLITIVSLVMIILGLQMLGIKIAAGIQLALPKSVTRLVAGGSSQSQWFPLLLGSGTFLLPCGFTLTTESMAVLSGDPLRGGMIMTAFVLGTMPALLLIGLSSVKFMQNHQLAAKFSQVAGILVLFFAAVNINSQLDLLGLPSLSNLTITQATGSINRPNNLPSVVSGQQIIKMNASSNGYQPNYFIVKAGVPVRWEITDTGTSGCTDAVISRNLFDGQIDLTPGQTSVKEFTPNTPGKYKFSCWMGMITGIIEVVSDNGASVQKNNLANSDVIESGAKGCGCGGGQP